MTSEFPAGLARREHPGPGPALLCVHATGFCKATWEPMVAELRAAGVANRVVAIDQRGHGDTTLPAAPYDWWDLGRDAAAAAAPLGAGEVVGVGHSSGAAALVMAELTAPGTFAALVLVEPIVFPGPFGRRADNPMSAVAERRRPAFASAEEALASYRGRGPFAGWDDRALAAYVEGCMRAGDGRWELKCAPPAEAEFYRQATAHGAWDRLGEVATPAVVVAGSESDSHPEEFAAEQAARLANASLVIVDGASHFVPMERPAVVAALVAEVVRGGLPAGRR